jgi:hypothetical protein
MFCSAAAFRFAAAMLIAILPSARFSSFGRHFSAAFATPLILRFISMPFHAAAPFDATLSPPPLILLPPPRRHFFDCFAR